MFNANKIIGLTAIAATALYPIISAHLFTTHLWIQKKLNHQTHLYNEDLSDMEIIKYSYQSQYGNTVENNGIIIAFKDLHN